MLTFTPQEAFPLSFLIRVQVDLDASYTCSELEYVPDLNEDSAKIVLSLDKTSSTAATFDHSFTQAFVGLSEQAKVTIYLNLKDENGDVITHQESATTIERPFIPQSPQ